MLQKIKEIQKDTSVNLETGDIVFISEYVQFDYAVIQHKVVDYLNNKNINITYAHDIKQANTLIIDINDVLIIDVYPEPETAISKIKVQNNIFPTKYAPYNEILYALNNNLKVINKKIFFDKIHNDLILIDETMYNSLYEMFESKQKEDIDLASEIISNTNRTDETTYDYLVKLYDKHVSKVILSNFSSFEFVTSITNDPRFESKMAELYSVKEVSMIVALSDMINETKQQLK
jgi:hypothetical protein